MVLLQVHIEGVRSIKNATLDELGRYNAIVGPNNAGKSALAEAIARHGAGAETSIGANELNPGWRTSFLVEVDEDIGRYVRRFGGDGDGYEVAGQELVRDRIPPFDRDWNSFRESIRYHGPFEQLGSENAATEQLRLTRKGTNLAQVLHTLEANDRPRFQQLEQSFLSIFPELSGVRTPINDRAAVRVEIEVGDTRLQLLAMGDGVARVLSMVTSLWVAPEQAVVLLEEPEMGLHPALQRQALAELLRVSEARSQQLIVLTHSLIWAQPRGQGSVFVVSSGGEVMNVTSITVARDSVGALASDLGFTDKVFFVEGETEERILPYLFGELGHDIDKLGIEVRNVGGIGIKPSQLKAEIGFAKQLSLSFRVALDWIDRPEGQVASDVARDLGMDEQDLTLWHKEDGTPGEIEDVFPMSILASCLAAQTGSDPAEIEEALRGLVSERGKKTSDAIGRIYYERTQQSISKPMFGMMAAEESVAAGQIPDQIRIALERITELSPNTI